MPRRRTRRDKPGTRQPNTSVYLEKRGLASDLNTGVPVGMRSRASAASSIQSKQKVLKGEGGLKIDST